MAASVVTVPSEDEWWGCMKSIEEKEEKKQILIRRVPQILRQKKKLNKMERCYDPLVVSVGPYHHGQPELQEVERLKIPLAREYVKDCKESAEEVYRKVETVSTHARSCFPTDATSEFDDTKFTRMLFLDGCFILQFLVSFYKEESTKGLEKNLEAFVQRDLFLLENQLPYQVLQAVMSSRFDETEGKLMINRFIYRTRGLNNPHPSWIERAARKFGLTAKPAGMELPKEPENPVHLLDIFRSKFVNKMDLMGYNQKAKGRYRFSYPAAKKLKASGIQFNSSNKDSFTDVRFTGGILTLPRIIVDDTNVCMLLNLVAYEACPDTPDDFGITSYVYFMHSLIDEAQDVEELRKKHIIYNMLENDNEAAEVFNEVAKDLVPSPLAFIHVKESIERRYEKNLKSAWVCSHFRSSVALIVAISAILLPSIQTYLSWVQFCLGDNHSYFWCPFHK